MISTRELAAFSRCPENVEFPLHGNSGPPYFPFKTLADFEQTELFVKRDQTDSEINDQLGLWRRHANGEGVTLKNAREMHQCLEAAGVEDDLSQVNLQSTRRVFSADNPDVQFERVEIEVPYKHKKSTEMRQYKVRFRPALDAVKHVLEDPALQERLIRYPEKHYVRKPGTDENMRVWSDVHTASDWWELQVVSVVLFSLFHCTEYALIG